SPGAGASLSDHLAGHVQANDTVGPPSPAGDLRIGMLGPYVIAEEPRRLAGGVGDQGLGLRQFQPQFGAQELPDLFLDLFGFVLGPGEAEQPVVAVAHVPQPPKVRIVRVTARQPAALLLEQSYGFPVAVADGL